MITQTIDEGEIPLYHLIPVFHRLIDFSMIKKKHGLTKSQLIFMSALQEFGSLNMSEIAELISSSKEQSTRTVAALVDRGLIKRFVLDENRKLVHIVLTDNGLSFMEEIRREMCDLLQKEVSESLSENEKQRLRESAAEVVAILSKVHRLK